MHTSHRTFATLIVAFLMMIGLSTSVFAQETEPTEEPPTQEPTQEEVTPEPMSADQPAQPTYDDFTMALQNASTEIGELGTVAADLTPEAIQVVSVSSLIDEGNQEAHTATLQEHQSSIDEVRTAFGEQPVLNEALNNYGLTTDQVVAFDVTDTGEVVIYHQ
jgi:hypothetical protein